MKPGPAISHLSMYPPSRLKFFTIASAIIRGAWWYALAPAIAMFDEKSPFFLSAGFSMMNFGISASGKSPL